MNEYLVEENVSRTIGNIVTELRDTAEIPIFGRIFQKEAQILEIGRIQSVSDFKQNDIVPITQPRCVIGTIPYFTAHFFLFNQIQYCLYARRI